MLQAAKDKIERNFHGEGNRMRFCCCQEGILLPVGAQACAPCAAVFEWF